MEHHYCGFCSISIGCTFLPSKDFVYFNRNFFRFFFELFSFKKVEIAFFLEIKKNHNFQSTHDFDFTAVLLEILGIDIELKIKVDGTKDCSQTFEKSHGKFVYL